MPVKHRKGKSVNEAWTKPDVALKTGEAFVGRVLFGTRILIVLITLVFGLKYWNRHDIAPSGSGDSNEPFRVAKIPGKGMGIIATQPIKRGQLLIREKPLFVVPSSITTSPSRLIADFLKKTDPSGREAFNNLSYVNFPEHLDPAKHPEEVALAIFQTNAVAAGDGVGIFPRMARLNHGCSGAFNAIYSWRKRDQVLVVHALKDINPGEELLTAYTDTKRTRAERRAYLIQQYGFSCSCNVCSLSDTESHASDRRLTEITGLYRRFSAWGTGSLSGSNTIAIARRIWAVEDKEGYVSERGRLAADAAWIAAAHSDLAAFGEWVKLSIEWYGYELGQDSDEVLQMRVYRDDPRIHPAFGTRQSADIEGRS